MDMNENKRRRSMLLYILIAIVAYLAISQTLYPNLRATQVESVTYSEFVDMVENDEVTQATSVYGNPEVSFATGEGDQQKLYSTVLYNGTEESTAQLLEKHDVQMVSEIQDTSGDLWLMLLISYGLPILIFLGIGWWLNRRMKKAIGDDGPSMNFGGGFGGGGLGKSNAKEIKGEETGVTFKDVAGQDEAKESLEEIVSFLKNPDKYTEIGARCPRGALLVGPPGTGKTLLAKAVAGEAGVTFFQIAGSAFVEMFVGRGAAKVRDLFKQANEKAPCIIFIDEIDAVGKRRDTSLSSNDEREQTLNQLLSEMDGFDNHKGIVVLAATNRPETLDQALLRPGRFDRRIPVELPDLTGREAILKIHADDVKMEPGIDLGVIARSTPGASGADLANIINEAALRAVRFGRRRVTQEDLLESVDVVIAGEKKKSTVLSPHEKEVVSYHETGHAIVAAMQKGSAPVSKITIVPRTSGALGFTMQVEEDEHFLTTRQEAKDKIAVLCGGRAAEELIFGEMTTGASNDIEKATQLARAMVTQYGMSDRFGMVQLGQPASRYLGGGQQLTCSEGTAQEIDAEVQALVEEGHQTALTTLRENRFKLHEIAHYLQKKETITGEEFMNILTRDDGFAPKMPAPAPPRRPYLKSCQNATAELAATLRESTPRAIGMTTERSQASRVARRRPGPSLPKTSARCSPHRRGASSSGTASGRRASARQEKPSSRRSESVPSGHCPSSARAQGSLRTQPIETRTARRESGSAQRGESTTASAPRAAAFLKMAPTLVTSTRSSSTATWRAPRTTSSTGRGAGRDIAQSSPRVRRKPVRRATCSWGSTYAGTSSGARARIFSLEARSRSSTRNETGRAPQSSATSTTRCDSATNTPPASSTADLS